MFFGPDIQGTPGVDPGSVHPRGLVVWLRNKFLTGLAVVTPLIVTFWILQFVYSSLHSWSTPLLQVFVDWVNGIAGSRAIDAAGSGFLLFERVVGVLIPIAVLVALGVLASNVIGRQVVETIDRLLLRVPFIRFIYRSLKQVIDAFKNFGGKQGFKRVVYIDYPATGMWMLGFVTGQFHDRNRNKAMSLVFIPGALSPMTGLLLAVETERLADAPMSMEEAMKLVFSGGLVAPDSQQAARPATEPVAVPPPRQDLPPGLPVADADDTISPIPPEPVGAASPSGWRRALASVRGAKETA